MASTDKGCGETLPDEEGISRHVDRDGVRGLGDELLLANVKVDLKWRYRSRCVWSHLFSRLVPADDRLKLTVTYYCDAGLLLGQGEHLLDIVIRRASQAEWTEWLRISLDLAVEVANADVFRTLLAVGGESMAAHTPSLLNAAVKRGNETIMSVLLDAGAGSALGQVDGPSATVKIPATGTEGKEGEFALPLHVATKAGNCSLMERLLQAGAGVNVVDTCGRTPLYFACLFPAESDVAENTWPIERLLIAGANPNMVGAFYGRGPLHWASYNNRREAVELLLRFNADDMLLDRDGKTPVDMLAKGVGEKFSQTLSTEQIADREEIRRLFECAPENRHWHRRGWLVMMWARQHTNSLDVRSDIVPLAAPTVTIADRPLGVVPKLAEEGNTEEAEAGINSCFYETVMWTVTRPMEEGLFSEVVRFL